MHSQFCAVQLHDQPKMYETNEGFAFYVTSLLEQLYLLDICCILYRYLLKVSSSRNNNPSFVDAYLNYPKVKVFISSSVFPIHQQRKNFSILTTRKYLKLEFRLQVSSISESSGQKNKFVRLFSGKSYGSTILFRDVTFSMQEHG